MIVTSAGDSFRLLCWVVVTSAGDSFHSLSFVYRLDTEEEMIMKTYDETQV